MTTIFARGSPRDGNQPATVDRRRVAVAFTVRPADVANLPRHLEMETGWYVPHGLSADRDGRNTALYGRHVQVGGVDRQCWALAASGRWAELPAAPAPAGGRHPMIPLPGPADEPNGPVGACNELTSAGPATKHLMGRARRVAAAATGRGEVTQTAQHSPTNPIGNWLRPGADRVSPGSAPGHSTAGPD